MGEHSTVLTFHEKALNIREEKLPANHPSLAISYNKIGGVYDVLGDYSRALSFYEKAVNIFQETVATDHSDFKSARDSIELVRKKVMEE